FMSAWGRKRISLKLRPDHGGGRRLPPAHDSRQLWGRGGLQTRPAVWAVGKPCVRCLLRSSMPDVSYDSKAARGLLERELSDRGQFFPQAGEVLAVAFDRRLADAAWDETRKFQPFDLAQEYRAEALRIDELMGRMEAQEAMAFSLVGDAKEFHDIVLDGRHGFDDRDELPPFRVGHQRRRAGLA